MSEDKNIDEIIRKLANKPSRRRSTMSPQKDLEKATMNNISKMDDATLLEISKKYQK